MPNIPLAVYIPPENLPDFFKPLVNNVVFTNEVLATTATGWSLSLELALANGTPISELIFPSVDLPVAVSFKNLTRLFIVKFLDDYALRYNPAEIDILLPSIFKNAQIDQSTGRLIAAGNGRAKINLTLQDKFVEINTINGVNFLMPDLSTFTPVINSSLLIGDTGIGLSLQELTFEANEEGIAAEVKKAKVYFPQNLGAPDIEINSGKISKNGFTGELKFDWDLQLENNTYKMNGQAVKLFEVFTGGLDLFAVTFENNAITSCQITGEMLIPYFNDKPLRINILINDEGKLVIGIQSAGEEDLKFTKDELLQLQLQSLVFDSEARSLTISGGLEPLLFAKDGVKWPRMDVKNLRIDSSGRISIDEAWLDLKDLVNLDLFGFHFELRKIGIGTTVDDKMWVDISGAVQLIEQLPLGLDVEGFRLTWPRILSFTPGMSVNALLDELARIEVQFQGVEINFAIPAVVKIDGLIRFFKEAQKVGFAGDMKLAVIPAGFSAEAGLMVGMNFDNPPYPFMYVYFGFESTAGIPLAQTGLALKGAIGLIGMNVEPKKTPEQHWYYDWYKGPPAPGVQQTTKWTDKRNAFAIGVGVTISTADGVVKKVQGLLVLALPGPILVINGKAFLLDTGLGSGEPPFEALAVFDGNEGTVLFNVQAQAEIVKDMIDAHAGVEAFFDFKDLTNWHLYIGQDVPDDRRIRANVMDIMTADAYLMLDMADADSPRMRAGVRTTIEPPIPDLSVEIADQEIGIKIDAWLTIDGNGEVSVNPEQFSGKVSIDGGLTVDAFGLIFGPSVEAHLDFDGPSPFKLEGGLEFTLDMWPEDFEAEAEFKLEIPSPPVLEVKNPVQSVSLFSRFINESTGIELCGDNYLAIPGVVDEKTRAQQSLVVQADVNPVIAFHHEMNQAPEMQFLMHPNEFAANSLKKYKAGKINLTPTVTSVEVWEKKKSDNWNIPWQKIYTTKDPGPGQLLRGAWLAESDPLSPGQPASRKLQLLTDNPLINTTHSYLMEAGFFLNTDDPKAHLSALLVDDYPGLMFESPKSKGEQCISFCMQDQADVILIEPDKPFNFGGLLFKSNSLLKIDCSGRKKPGDCCCLQANENLEIIFPEEIADCRITYCDIPDQDGKPEIHYYLGKREITTLYSDYNSLNNRESTWYKTSHKGNFNRIMVKGVNFSIQQICFATKSASSNEKINDSTVDRNKGIANGNNATPAGQIKPYLNPGCYYKIVVYTAIHASNRPAPYQNALPDEFFSTGGHSYTAVAYFQTNAPPNNLLPYIKWTYPNQELNRVYCKDEFAICFKRDYMEDFFGGAADQLKNYKMNAYVLDAQNKLIPANVQWPDGGAMTLFPDELTWEVHKHQYNLAPTTRREDLLVIKPQQTLLPNQKYNLILTGGDGGLNLIAGGLEKENMPKFWKDVDANWAYDDAKVLSAKSTGTKELFTIKEDYENVELSVEVKGGQFVIVFRHKKLNSKDIQYWINVNLNTGFADLHAHGLSAEASRSFRLPMSALNIYDWINYKLRITGNLVSLFLFEKLVINQFDLSQLHATTVRMGLESVEVDVEHNSSGAIGFKVSQAQLRNIQLRNAELLRIPFYTTGFNLRSRPPGVQVPDPAEYIGKAVDFKTVEIAGNINLTASEFNTKYTAVANAAFDFYKSVVDMEYGMARNTNSTPSLFGREAVEKFRSALRERKATLDDHFNTRSLNLAGGEIFNEAKGKCNVVGLKSKNASGNFAINGFYIKLPERLNITLPGSKDPYGRTLLTHVNGSTTNFEMIFNSDGDQILVKLQNPIPMTETKKQVKFIFRYTNNFKDGDNPGFFEQSAVKHHRYDRPVVNFSRVSEEISFTVEF